MREDLTPELFQAHLKSTFTSRLKDGSTTEFQLLSYEDLGSTPQQEQFSLVFYNPRQFVYPQGIYKLEHETAGTFELFLVPIKEQGAGIYYEAVFNRLKDSK